MDEIIIDTNETTIRTLDPNKMSGQEWINYQINQPEYISGKGIVEIINKMFHTDIIGCEIGVCLGTTSKYIVENVKNLKNIYCVDSYPVYTDWNGTIMDREKQDAMKDFAYNNLKNYHDKITFINESSLSFSKTISEESLDFVFIDGDHSYDGALDDFNSYFSLVKKGGIFSGHDFSLRDVNMALQQFLQNRFNEVIPLENNAWYLIK